YIRLGILETPIFQQVIAEERVARAPVVEVFKRQPKEIILTALVRMGQMAPIFIYIAFVFPYGTEVVHLSRDFILLVLLIGSFMSFFTIPLSGCRIGSAASRCIFLAPRPPGSSPSAITPCSIPGSPDWSSWQRCSCSCATT